ncbi:hypothetical protein [Sphingomonas sp.]|uniref:hypothetical protein n=1 Tax=Sphingomonas sp. TaxID=28214 RepID=UPI001B26459C|nr:hypothetical protein [Sphingomonas sp.]MBO9711744.1 hypothetical protein [Sphingomonas sp.]
MAIWTKKGFAEMLKIDAAVRAVRVAGGTIGDNLDRAEAEGAILRAGDGRYRLPPSAQDAMGVAVDRPHLLTAGRFRPHCHFLNSFTFTIAYGRAQVPFGCRNCYKLVAAPRSFHQLMVMKPLAEATGETTKSAVEAFNPLTPRAYGTILYVEGRDAAVRTARGLRRAIDDHAELGPDVALFVRRGCQNYERHCGPSDRYAIDPALEAVEDALHDGFAERTPTVPAAMRDAASRLRMITIAAQIGDVSSQAYGRPFFPAGVTYAFDEGSTGPDAA